MEDTNEGRPSGYKEVKRAEVELKITESDLPWMTKKYLDNKMGGGKNYSSGLSSNRG